MRHGGGGGGICHCCLSAIVAQLAQLSNSLSTSELNFLVRFNEPVQTETQMILRFDSIQGDSLQLNGYQVAVSVNVSVSVHVCVSASVSGSVCFIIGSCQPIRSNSNKYLNGFSIAPSSVPFVASRGCQATAHTHTNGQ